MRKFPVKLPNIYSVFINTEGSLLKSKKEKKIALLHYDILNFTMLFSLPHISHSKHIILIKCISPKNIYWIWRNFKNIPLFSYSMISTFYQVNHYPQKFFKIFSFSFVCSIDNWMIEIQVVNYTRLLLQQSETIIYWNDLFPKIIKK